MILRRLALFFALLFGVALTQIPEFVQQYRQALGGAIGEIAADVARFDSDSAQQNLTQAQAIDRLRSNPDQLAQQRGEAMHDNVDRLNLLREAQERFRTEGPIGQFATFVTHYDGRIGQEVYSDFRPAVPTTPEAFVLGVVGFVFGGGVIHMAGRPLRRRIRNERTAQTTA